MAGERYLLFIATQCRAMPYLEGLNEAAARLRADLLDPAMGGCVPALPGGGMLGGRRGADEVGSEAIRSAISQASRRAADAEATLVLALLGHGFSPGETPVLHYMGADSRDGEGDTAVSVPTVLGYAVDTPGVNGVIAVVDTCGGADANPLAYELTRGRRGGKARLTILTASAAGQDAYDLRLSRMLAELMQSGLPGAPATLTVEMLARELKARIPGQNINHSSYDGAVFAAESLWLSRNRMSTSEGPAERLDDRTYRNACRGYLKWAAAKWRNIDLGDLGAEPNAASPERVTRLPLNKMYISLQADPRSVSDRQRQENQERTDRDAGVPPRTSRKENIRDLVAGGPQTRADPGTGGEAGSTPEPGISLEDAFARHSILVVLGDPGSGKSVLCQHLGHETARETRTMLGSGRSGPVRIPMLFRAVDYAKFYAPLFAQGNRPGSISEFLAATLSEEVGYPPRVLRGMFERALTDGEAVLLIDELDELVANRNEVVEALAATVETHVVTANPGHSQAVITSRIWGYDDVYLTIDEAAHYFIRPMTTDQVSTFVASFFRELKASDQAPLLLRHLAESTSHVVRRLATTPLLLTSMCSYWHRHRELPASRSALYRQLLLDTAYRWRGFADSSDGSALDDLLGDEDDFLDMLAEVAVRIHDEHLDGRINLDELLDALDDALYGSRRYTQMDANDIALELVDRIQAKVGILAEFAGEEFGFIHGTFREYLAGRYLLHKFRDPSGDDGSAQETLFLRILERVGDPRWREPLVMALGECLPATRTALMILAKDTPGLDVDEWTSLFMAAVLELPTTNTAEMTTLLELAMHAAEQIRDMPELPGELDAQLGRLRRHLGPERFDFLAMSLFGENAALAPAIAALYWRRRWLTSDVLAAIAAAPQRDSPVWGWPIQRALRRAAGPEPLREITIQPRLDQPAPDEDAQQVYASRLYELGRRAWEDQRQWDIEKVFGEPPAGSLPLRDLFMDQPARWDICLSDLGSASVLCALFGGLNHHDSLRWAGEYNDFARMLNKPDGARADEIELRAAELVPRFNLDDIVYSIAVLLDTVGNKVTYAKPEPAIGTEWLSRPSTATIRDTIRRWVLHAPGDHRYLRRQLEQVAGPGSAPTDRAEAELGLLVLDGRPMTADAESIHALQRALEASADAMIRGHATWFQTVWNTGGPVDEAERAVLHRFVLGLIFLVANGPIPLSPGPLNLGDGSSCHPVLEADALARKLLAVYMGEVQPEDLGELARMPPRQVLAVLAWLSTLPYWDISHRVVNHHRTALWHEDMPNAEASLPGPLGLTLRSLLAWAHEVDPQLEPELSAVTQDALSATRAHGLGAALPPPIANLYSHLIAEQGLAEPAHLQRIMQAARAAPGARTDLAYLAVALSIRAPHTEWPLWQNAALDLLAGEPDEIQRAEALYRFRPYLDDDPAVQRRFGELADGISSLILRADATGDLRQTAAELISRLGFDVGLAAKVSLQVVASIAGELTRIAVALGLASGDRPNLIGDDLAYLASQPGASVPWRLELRPDALAAIEPDRLVNEDEDESTAYWLSMVSRVDESMVAGLSALIGQAPPTARWAATARNLLTLLRAATDRGYPGMFADLNEMTSSADAVISARAQLVLLGPLRGKNRDSRYYALSVYGLDRWWELGALSAIHPDGRSLYAEALSEWIIDDAGAVRQAARRAEAGHDSRTVWRRLIATASIWRDEAQDVLAGYLDSASADATDAELCLKLISMLATAGHQQRPTERLYASVARACARHGNLARTLPGLGPGEWRLAVAQPVADSCREALASGVTEPTALDIARARLLERTTAVITIGRDGMAEVDLEGYGNLLWIPLGIQPAQAAVYVSAELRGEEAVALLNAWLRELEAEGAWQWTESPLAYATREAVLNVLVVLSARDDGRAFRACSPPESMQPLLSQVVLDGSELAAIAGLILLNRLMFVDLVPPEGPDLVHVMEVALNGPPGVQQAVQEFLRTVRYVRGKSFAEAILSRIEQTPNESVAQGLAGLAAAYLESPTCSSADRRQILQFLRSGTRRSWPRRPVYLAGTGVDNDPVRPVIGPGRPSEFRRLLQRSASRQRAASDRSYGTEPFR